MLRNSKKRIVRSTLCVKCQGPMRVVGGILRCQNCGHQQGAQGVFAGQVLVAEGVYEQPGTDAPATMPEVGVHKIWLNPLGISGSIANYLQPHTEAPKLIVTEPVRVNESAPAKNYEQPGTETAKINTGSSCGFCGSSSMRIIADGSWRCQDCGNQQGGPTVRRLSQPLKEDPVNHQQVGTEAPAPKPEAPWRKFIPVQVEGNYFQPGTENPQHEIGVPAPHLNALEIGGKMENYIQADYRKPV